MVDYKVRIKPSAAKELGAFPMKDRQRIFMSDLKEQFHEVMVSIYLQASE